MTTLTLVRHGETDWNKEIRAQGQRDIPLNEAGLLQAEALAARLGEQSVDVLYASDLSRAWVTAGRIALKLGQPVYPDRRLRERSHGRLEGTTVAERVALWGEDWAKLDHQLEPLESVRRRGLHFVRDVIERHPGAHVMAVSHGAFIAELISTLLADTTIRHVDNTSVSVLQYDGTVWQGELLNCIRHLA